MGKKDGNEIWLREIVSLAGTHLAELARQYPQMFSEELQQKTAAALALVSGENEAASGGDLKEMSGEGEKSVLETLFFHTASVLGLSWEETLCLLWSLAPYLDGRIAGLYERFSAELGGKESGYLTGKLAEALCRANYPEQEGKIRDVFFREGFGLLWETDPGFAFQVRKPVRRLLLQGGRGPGEVPGVEKETPEMYAEAKKEPVGENRFAQFLRESKAPCVCLYGKSGIGKRYALSRTAAEWGRPVVWVDYEIYRRENKDPAPLLFEARVMDGILGIRHRPGAFFDPEAGEAFADFKIWLRKLSEAFGSVVWICDSEEKPDLGGLGTVCCPYRFPAPSLQEQKAYWREFSKDLPLGEDADPEAFADRYDLTPEQIKGALHQARFAAAGRGEAIRREDLQKGCILQLDHRLGQKARKIQARYRMDDLVLPPLQKTLLKEACGRIRFRSKVYAQWGFEKKIAYGRGVSAAFLGPPGTGKTMAAQVLAGELGLELYQINLASVVSKYIGETERNLELIFDEAKKSQGILFFDEADVLFGKRTEIKDSNDKYSNMEAAYMLQKMEEYDGMAILATNYQQNMDEAFRRRLSFLIDFPFPTPEFRRQIWEKVLPEELPLSGEIDLAFLAEQFEFSGSNIKNAAVSAAFLAAADGRAVSMEYLLRGAMREMEKCGRKVRREEMGIYRDLL